MSFPRTINNRSVYDINLAQVAVDIVPAVNDGSNLGSSSKHFNVGYIDDVQAATIECSNCANNQIVSTNGSHSFQGLGSTANAAAVNDSSGHAALASKFVLGNSTIIGSNATIPSGVGNTILGGGAGSGLTSEVQNTCVGDAATVFPTFSNSTALGHQANATASNQIMLGSNNVTQIACDPEAVCDIGSSGAPFHNIYGANATLSGLTASTFLQASSGNVVQSVTPSANSLLLYNNSSAPVTAGTVVIGADTILGQLCPASAGSSTLIGNQAGKNMTGSTTHNVCVGNVCGEFLQSTAHDNVAMGFGALKGVNDAKNDASNNTAIGSGAMGVVTTGGNSNTAIGNNCLPIVAGGANNTAVGDSACPALTAAGQTVALGNGAGATISTEIQNICIGSGSGITAGNTNVIVLGTTALSDKSNQIKMGNSSHTECVPESDAVINLGSATNLWNNVYANNGHIGSVTFASGNTALNYYDEQSSISGNVGSSTQPIASTAVTLMAVRVGKMVTLFVPQVLVNGNSHAGNITSTVGIIPSAYRPTTTINCAYGPAQDNGTNRPGQLNISSAGTLTFFVNFSGWSSNAGTANNGWVAFTVSYLLL